MAVNAQVDCYLEAELAVLEGKEIIFTGRKQVMADLPQIRAGAAEWNAVWRPSKCRLRPPLPWRRLNEPANLRLDRVFGADVFCAVPSACVWACDSGV